MTPILDSIGGYFRADFRISEVLIAPSNDSINRVFILSFPDEETKNRFFEFDSYKAVRAQHFDSSVQSVTMIASYTHTQT